MKYINSVYYCGAWGQGFDKIPDDALDCLDIFFYSNADVTPDAVVFNNPSEAEQAELLHTRRPDMPVILSTVGYGSVCGTPKQLDDAAARVVRAALDAGFDGVDVDWEFPSREQACLHTRLLRGLRRGLDEAQERSGRKYYLTCAVPTTKWALEITELESSHTYLDYINIMTYDVYSERHITGHHTAPLPSSRAAFPCASLQENYELFAGVGIPARKLLGGVAFYSRVWHGVTGGDNGLGAQTGGCADYGPKYCEITDEYISDGGFTQHRDPEAQAPWLWNGSDFITYDDERTVALKCDITHRLGAGGLMAWEYACDTSEHKLLKLMRDKLKD